MGKPYSTEPDLLESNCNILGSSSSNPRLQLPREPCTAECLFKDLYRDIVRHPYTKDPKKEPNLENYPYLDGKEPTLLKDLYKGNHNREP